MRKNLLAVFAISIYASLALAQPLCRVQTFTTENGLPASVVSNLAQTSDNLLWLSSWNGLSCYDGYRFTTFCNAPGNNMFLSSNHLLSVSAGHDDNLWLETYPGDVYLFDTHGCRFVNVSKLLKGDTAFRLRKVYTLANGVTWLVGKDDTHYRIAGHPESKGSITEYRFRGTMKKAYYDARGMEWCLTSDATYLNGKKCSDEAYEFVLDVHGTTWLVGTDGKVAAVTDGGKIARQKSPNHGMSPLKVFDAEVFGKSGIVLGTSAGLMVYDTRSGNVMTDEGGNTSATTEIHIDRKGRVWCFNSMPGVALCHVTARGITVQRLNTAVAEDEALQYTIADRPVFHEDRNGTVWMIPVSGTFSYYDDEKARLVPCRLEALSLRYKMLPRVKRAFSDKQGNLWLVGPHNLSVVSFSHDHVRCFEMDDNREVRSVLHTRDGGMLLGNIDGCIARFDAHGRRLGYLAPSGRWQKAKVSFSTHIYALCEDPDGTLWIGSRHRGLYVVAPDGTVRHCRHDKADAYSLSSDEVYDIRRDTKGRMMIATFSGGLNIVSKDDGGEMRFIHSGNDLALYDGKKYNKVRRILPLPDGVVLLSTTDGLLTFSDSYKAWEKVRFFASCHTDDEASLYSSEVMQTCRTSDGRIFVTTLGGGLQQIATSRLLQANLKMKPLCDASGKSIDVLAGENTILGLAADGDRGLWIVGESRVAYFRDGTLVLCTAKDLGNVSFTEARPSYDPRTKQLVACGEGCALAVSASEMRRQPSVPSIVFTAIQYMDIGHTMPLLNMETLEVDAGHRSFAVYFSAIDYTDNAAIRYAYKIDDGKWEYVRAGQNMASFNDFPHGRHTLHVKSTDANGVWTANVKTLEIYAEPTFAESWWGRTLMALLAAGVVALALVRYLRHRTREITEVATERADAGKVRYILRQPEVVDEEKAMMEKLMTFIESRIADPALKIDDMAAAVNQSRTVFYGNMKTIVDMSPIDFLRHVRMQRAEDLIRLTDKNVSTIAYEVGFTDPKYFSKCFRKHTGMSPSEYRQTHEAKPGED